MGRVIFSKAQAEMAKIKKTDIPRIDTDVEELEFSYIFRGNAKWPLGKKIWQFLKKLNIPFDSAITLLDIF